MPGEKRIKQIIKNDLWLVLFDILSVNLSYYLTLLIRFYVNNQFRPTVAFYLTDFYHFAPWYTVISVIIFAAFRLYGSMWRYAGLNDMNRIIGANAATALVQVFGTLIFIRRMPISYYIIGAGLQLIMTTMSRFTYRIITEEREKFKNRSSSNVMIVGIGETGRIVRRQIEGEARPVVLFTYRENEAGANLDGIPVVSGIEQFKDHLTKYQVKRVILADTLMPKKIRNRIREICEETDVEVQDFSGYTLTDSSNLSFQHLMEYVSGPVSIVIDGKEQEFNNAELALMTLVGKHDVKEIFLKNNKLSIELASYKVEPLELFYITNRPDVALVAEKYGVDRIWIDIETRGKEERQHGMNTVKSHHTVEDVALIKPLLSKSKLMVRVNSWYDGSKEEIEAAIAAGADIIMLPYWKTLQEVKNFTETVRGRCKTSLLLETKEAVEIIDDVLTTGGFDEIHIGLNDLGLSYGLTFMFELLSNGTVEMLCGKFRSAGIPYGFGGIAKLGDGLLPAEKIIMEHYRLGSTRAILSRTFCDTSKIEDINEIDNVFRENMGTLLDYEQSMADVTREEFIRNKMTVCESVDAIVERIVKVRSNEG